MADHSPGHDPLGDRLRATFNAELDDMERRTDSRAATSSRGSRIPLSSRIPLGTLIPVGIAAAVIALAGLFVLSTRGGDETVGLDIANQQVEADPVSSYEECRRIPPSETVFAVPAMVGDVVVIAQQDLRGPNPTAAALNLNTVLDRFTGGCLRDGAGGIWLQFDVVGSAVWVAEADLIATQTSCRLLPNTVVPGFGAEVNGGVAFARSGGFPYEVLPASEVNFSVEECDALQLGPNPQPATLNECGDSVPPGPRFVIGIDANDPDGGLVAQTLGSTDAVTRIIPLDGVVEATGGCLAGSGGAPLLELDDDQAAGREWVSGNNLMLPQPACLVGEQFGTRTRSGELGVTDQIFGPLDGLAFVDGDRTAFAPLASDTYRWYPNHAIRQARCEGTTSKRAVCLQDQVILSDLILPEPVLFSEGPIDARTTGKTMPSQSDPNGEPLVEVMVTLGDIDLIGYVDPATTTVVAGTCFSFPDDLASRPCAIDENTPAQSSGTAGSSDSMADHIHNLRVEESAGCVRIVIELGTNAWTDNDAPALLVPEIEVTKDTDSVEIRFDDCDGAADCPIWSAGANEPQRVDFNGGTIFLAQRQGSPPYIQVLYNLGLSSVTLFESPARLVIDWRPTLLTDAPVLLEHAIFEKPPLITTTIQGWARPFEAQGTLMVLAAPNGEIGPTPTAVWQAPLMTAGWINGWGEFTVTLPELEPGDYVLAFGEFPPTDGPLFVGSGMRVRVGGDESPPWGNPYIDRIELDGILVLD